ncbi:MAG TPA: hypothetical protein VF691_08460 [Cytophagaceae bacterium]
MNLLFRTMTLRALGFLLVSPFVLFSCTEEKINRKELVERHNITIQQNNPKKPMQVGNGELAYNVDITGMQTFDPHNTMAHWAWHTTPLPAGLNVEDFKGKVVNIAGRDVQLSIENPEQPELSKWLAANPHPVNLGRIGLYLTHKDGAIAELSNLKNTKQHLNMWTGIITSSFDFDGSNVTVLTACDPTRDELGIEVNSELISKGQLKIFVEFPYADDREYTDFVGDFASPQKHTSTLQSKDRSLYVTRTVDDLKYFVKIASLNKVKLGQIDSSNNPHKILIVPTENISKFTFAFSKDSIGKKKSQDDIFHASKAGWEKYWLSGAAIDFSECTDPRAKELERRVVISQYLMKVNNSGSLPPAESGLMKNNWYGKFHFEMLWWHGVHFALWNRWNELDEMLTVYKRYLATSIERAKRQGYEGARWTKAAGNIDRDWPFVINAVLIWQQPHPIYFADLDYRLHPTEETLEKWKEVVFATAEFMASYPVYDSAHKRYNLVPPLATASENTPMDSTINPAFELGYWRYGLRTAIKWRKKLRLPASTNWNEVLSKLAPLPIQDKKYVTFEGIKDMWTKYNYEHPTLLATYGMLPGDGVDTAIMNNTFTEVLKTWNHERVWGWDYPVFAMTATRLNKPETAIDMLLFQGKHNSYDSLGYNSWVYLPANGGLLTTIAMMAGGWDGGPETAAPGFPKNGQWNVKCEGFVKMP